MSGRVLYFLGCCLAASLTAAPLPKIASGLISVELQTVATKLNAPLNLVPANDGSGRLFIVEQSGRIKAFANGTIIGTYLDMTAQIKSGGEEGLLGFAFHPGFSNSSSPGYRKLYTYATEPNKGAGADFTVPMSGTPANQIVIAEWQVSSPGADVVDPSSKRVVLRINHPQTNHNGGMIAFRPSDGYLYFGLGDGGAGNDVGDGHTPNLGNGQDLNTVLGKILRIDPVAPALTGTSTNPISANGKYRIPASNPFVGVAGLDEIFAYGFRNPYRWSFDPVADQLVVGDVGQGTIEEVDLVEAGKNYGWNKKEGSFLFNPANGTASPDPSPNPALINPTLQYDHGDGISVIGGFVYRGSGVPALSGKYVFGDYAGPGFTEGRLFVGDLSTGAIQTIGLGLNPRTLGTLIKAFGQDMSGEIYLVTDSGGTSGGQIFKIVPIPATPELLNLSTRARVETDDNGIAIAGFIITGSAAKTMVLRGLGPSLTVGGQPVAGRLSNPSLGLQDSTGAQIAANDDWMSDARKQELINFSLAPSDAVEAAFVVTLPPGAYTTTLRGVGGATGIALVEVYDVSSGTPANAVNLSTRGRVQLGDDVLIGGVIIGGTQTQRVLLRAIGPELTGRGVAGALQNPTLELVNVSGMQVAFNDNWRSDQQTEINATGIAPTDDRESAIIRTLSPGNYTAVVRGAGNTTGVALVEVYRLIP